MPRHGAVYSNEAWLRSLSGSIGSSQTGHPVWAEAANPQHDFAHLYLLACVEFHASRSIGHARLKLRRVPAIGLVVTIESIHLRAEARGRGFGNLIVASWVDGLRGLGVGALQFDAVHNGHVPNGRTFWARDGVLFRDPHQPALLLQARLNSLSRRVADLDQGESTSRSSRVRLLRRRTFRRPDAPE